MKNFSIAAASLITLAASAADPLPVVKTSSGVCGNLDQTLTGSGTLFRHGADLYVLTSEHVVAHALRDPHYCHAIESATISRRSVELVSADWGTGLALLKFHGSFAAPSLAELRLHSRQTVTGSVSSLGYPAESQTSRTSTGKVLTAQGDRHLIPFLKSTIETENVHGEYGMSGGALIDASGNFQGVLSHQYFNLVPGNASPILESTRGETAPQNHLVVIPATAALDWTADVLAKRSAPSFVRDPEEQVGLRKSESIISENLRFTLKKGQNLRVSAGGGDGAGIGGTEMKTTAAIEVTAVRGARRSVFQVKEHANWFHRLQSHVTTGESFFVDTFSEERSEGKRARNFQSLAEFATGLKHADWTPLAYGTSEIGNHLQKPTRTLQAWLQSHPSEGVKTFEARALWADLQLLRQSLLTEGGSSLTNQWLDTLIRERAEGWSEFMRDEVSTDEVVLVIAALREVQATLAKRQLN